MKNEIKHLKEQYRKSSIRTLVSNPLFGYVILAVILAASQLLFMFGDGIISLTVSKAISQTMIYAIAAMGLGILVGMAGLTSLGTAAFIGLGAYIAGNILKALPVPFTVVLITVTLVAIILGLVIGFISLRVEGVHLLIITLALAFLLNEFFTRPNDFTGGANGLTKVPFPKLFAFLQLKRDTVFFVVLIVMFLVIMLTVNIITSPTGRAMLTMRNSKALAQAMGINILRHRMIAFVIATSYAMIAGALYVSSITSATPQSWNMTLSLNILAAVILGGGVMPIGSILGAFIIFCLDLAVLKNISFFNENPNASLIFTGVLIVLIVVKYPGGLMRLFNNIRLGIKNLIEKRRLYKYGPNK